MNDTILPKNISLLNRNSAYDDELEELFPTNASVDCIGGSANCVGGSYPGTLTTTGGIWTYPGSIPVGNGSACSGSVSVAYPSKSAAGDFFKIQYSETEVRCAITRKMLPAGSPVMLLGGMVISAEAFERFLEENLSGLIARHQDLHTDSGYEE